MSKSGSIPFSTTPPTPHPAPAEEEDNGDDNSDGGGDDTPMDSVPELDPGEPMLEDDFDENNPPTDKAEEQQVDKLLHALWQRQDKDWTIRKFLKPVFQQLCFESKLSHRGTKADI